MCVVFMLQANATHATSPAYPSGTRSYTTTLRLGAATSIENARLLKLLSGTPAACQPTRTHYYMQAPACHGATMGKPSVPRCIHMSVTHGMPWQATHTENHLNKPSAASNCGL